MITNTIGLREMRARNVSPTAELDSVEEEMTNNMPTLRSTIKTKAASGNNTDGSKKKAQGKCRGRCGKESTRVCSKCTHPTDPTQQQYWFCDPCKEGGCKKWLEHLAWHQENDA